MITNNSKTSEIFAAFEAQILTGKMVVYAITNTGDAATKMLWVIKKQNDVPSNGDEAASKSFQLSNMLMEKLQLTADVAPTRNLYRAMLPMAANVVEAMGWKVGGVIEDAQIVVEHATKPYFTAAMNNGKAQEPVKDKNGNVRTFKGEVVYMKTFVEHNSVYKGQRTLTLDKVSATKVDLAGAFAANQNLNVGFNQ